MTRDERLRLKQTFNSGCGSRRCSYELYATHTYGAIGSPALWLRLLLKIAMRPDEPRRFVTLPLGRHAKPRARPGPIGTALGRFPLLHPSERSFLVHGPREDSTAVGNSFGKTKRQSKINDVGRRQLPAQHPIGNGTELDVRPEIHALSQIMGERPLDSYVIER
jgi:hypothetical protein